MEIPTKDSITHLLATFVGFEKILSGGFILEDTDTLCRTIVIHYMIISMFDYKRSTSIHLFAHCLDF